ncbi:MAG: cytochrome c-type biogenesis protein [Actinomycetota bacterium]
MNKTTLAMAACAAVLFGAIAWVAFAPSGPGSFKERVDSVASSLRCPVCESLSVKDSTSDVAQEMRGRIEEGMRAGRSADEIKASFVEAYGESVLLTPEPRGVNLVAWVVPVLSLLGGGALAIYVVRRWTTTAGSGA